MIVWKALEALALTRGEATHSGVDPHSAIPLTHLAPPGGELMGVLSLKHLCALVLAERDDVVRVVTLADPAGIAAQSKSDQTTVLRVVVIRPTATESAQRCTPPSVEVVAPATASRATSKRSGNFRPLRLARFNTPCAAFWLKKNRSCVVGSRMSDNEDTTAPLWNSEVTAVENSVPDSKPEVGQRRKHDPEVPAAVRGEKSGYVFQEDPASSLGELKLFRDARELEEESAARSVESGSTAGDTEVLAGEASAEDVCFARCPAYQPYVFLLPNGRESLQEHTTTPRVDLAGEGDFDSGPL